MNKLLPIVVIALLAGPALAKDPPKQSQMVGALEACRAIADPTQRLQIDFFVPDEMPPPKGVSLDKMGS